MCRHPGVIISHLFVHFSARTEFYDVSLLTLCHFASLFLTDHCALQFHTSDALFGASFQQMGNEPCKPMQ